MSKDDGAFLTIGELAQQLGVAQHILRYWETRFPQLRPVQRSGNRRYYRPGDVAIAQHINRLLNDEGFTVRGAQRALKSFKGTSAEPVAAEPAPAPVQPAPAAPAPAQPELPIAPPLPPHLREGDISRLIARLTVIRQTLFEALQPG